MSRRHSAEGGVSLWLDVKEAGCGGAMSLWLDVKEADGGGGCPIALKTLKGELMEVIQDYISTYIFSL